MYAKMLFNVDLYFNVFAVLQDTEYANITGVHRDMVGREPSDCKLHRRNPASLAQLQRVWQQKPVQDIARYDSSAHVSTHSAHVAPSRFQRGDRAGVLFTDFYS